MLDLFLFVGLPYVALAAAIVGGVSRWRSHRLSLTARSSQFLESKQLRWGSLAWHLGIIVILVGHLLALFLPQVWSAFVAVPAVLYAVEVVGAAAALLSLAGLTVLAVRRIRSRHVQAVTTNADLLVVALLVGQVVLGVVTAAQVGHGSVWAMGTVVPYLFSVFALQPEPALVVDLPAVLRLHIVGAWLLVFLFPFTRLVHIVTLPIGYLWRAPQIVTWSSLRRRAHAEAAFRAVESRRAFLKGSVGVAGAGGLLALGVSEKVVNYFRGPGADPDVETELLEKKLTRLQQTAEERALELERQRSPYILVAAYVALEEAKGKYFIDYSMAPGLAFRGTDGVPILRSAKCTHLGCTVGSEMDSAGRLLCPCHVSYFDVRTGQPNPGAPAKLPLPELGWALLDGNGAVVASKDPGGELEGPRDPASFAACSLYITRPSVA